MEVKLSGGTQEEKVKLRGRGKRRMERIIWDEKGVEHFRKEMEKMECTAGVKKE